jgi:hypothetical protein
VYTFIDDAPASDTLGHTGTALHVVADAQGTHDDAPAPLTLSLGHGVHTDAPAELNVIGGHIARCGVDDVDADGHAKPALQLLHATPPPGLNWPA